jgi:hypothetical protein
MAILEHFIKAIPTTSVYFRILALILGFGAIGMLTSTSFAQYGYGSGRWRPPRQVGFTPYMGSGGIRYYASYPGTWRNSVNLRPLRRRLYNRGIFGRRYYSAYNVRPMWRDDLSAREFWLRQ